MYIWLVNANEPVPYGDTEVRLFRMGILAEILADAGHEVVWWSSTFDHFNKLQRSVKHARVQLRDNMELRLLRTDSYKKNVSLARMFSYNYLSKRLIGEMEKESRLPDIILCSVPIIELAEKSVEYGNKVSVPVVLDMRDMWPDIIANLFPKPFRWLARILLTPLRRKMERACRGAFAIIGITSHFVDWGLGYAARPKGKLDRFFPHGYKASKNSKSDTAEFWKDHGVSPGDFNVVFFGGLGRQFEIGNVIEAARLLEKQDRPIKFIICGSGDYLSDYKEQTRDAKNIIFPGWIDRKDIDSLMTMAKVGLAPYKSKEDFMASLPNKVFEYMSGGLPIVSSLKGEVEALLKEYNCGITYENNSPDSLAKSLISLYDSPALLNSMGSNGENAYLSRFRAEKVYMDLANYLVEVTNEYKSR